MQNGLFTLNSNDFVKGLVTAVVGAIAATIYGIVVQAGFELFTADWSAIGMLALKAAIIAFVSYLGKNYMSDSQGRVLGRIG